MLAIEPIGYIQSPFGEKFGAPRQPGLAPSARAYIELVEPYNDPDALRGLEQCSHLWLIFHFSETAKAGWKPLTRPPRLGGNEKLGVFATRSTHRPNALGLSAVKLESIETIGAKTRLIISGADLINGTPIIDIKPYIPYADCIAEAQYPGMEQPLALTLPVNFLDHAQQFLTQLDKSAAEDLTALISEVLKQDPRPAYQRDELRIYGVELASHNVKFRITDVVIEVIDIKPI
jgi:tRNA-Thr(GGU) m(6)t(6)A37 methyltransferase TsaA